MSLCIYIYPSDRCCWWFQNKKRKKQCIIIFLGFLSFALSLSFLACLRSYSHTISPSLFPPLLRFSAVMMTWEEELTRIYVFIPSRERETQLLSLLLLFFLPSSSLSPLSLPSSSVHDCLVFFLPLVFPFLLKINFKTLEKRSFATPIDKWFSDLMKQTHEP